MPLLTTAGAYPDISAESYHRDPDLLPGPSLSSSGAKVLLGKSPRHFWFDSCLNPDRPAEADKAHFNVGRAAHDMILLADSWPGTYHVTPKDYRAPSSRTVNFTAEQLAAKEAGKAGKTILSHEQHQVVLQVAKAIEGNELAVATLTNGVTEETLVWQDPVTGVWLRARPDFRPHSIIEKRKVMVVPDLKFVAPTHADPEGFGKAIYNFGYAISAGFYSAGIKAIYGHAPTHWLHVVVEKEPPFCVSLYELPQDDVLRGQALMRRAVDLFAHCLETDSWPGYADRPLPVGLPVWAQMRMDELAQEDVATRYMKRADV